MRPFLAFLIVVAILCTVSLCLEITEVSSVAGGRLRLEIKEGSQLPTWHYGADLAWTDPKLNDQSWASSPPSTTRNVTWPNADDRFLNGFSRNSFFMRCSFEVDATEAANDGLQLSIDWHDGFIAYLNGYEVDRANMGPKGMFYWYDQQAANQRKMSLGRETRTLNLNLSGTSLVPGKNVLSLQVHRMFYGYIQMNYFQTALSVDFGLSLGSGGRQLISATSQCRLLDGYMMPSGQHYDKVTGDEPGSYKDSYVDPGDWIELYHNLSSFLQLKGYSLTDDELVPRKWVFKEGLMAPGAYWSVFCDGEDRKGDFFHTNFSLSDSGGYVTLYDPKGKKVQRFEYPKLSPFHSYGVDLVTKKRGYLFPHTPGALNLDARLIENLTDSPNISPNAGIFLSNETLTVNISCKTLDAQIFYTLDATFPTRASTLYTGPFDVNSTTVVRAMAFSPTSGPSDWKSETYIFGDYSMWDNLIILSFTGDPNRDIYKPAGFLSINAGRWVDINLAAGYFWYPNSDASYDDYNLLYQRENGMRRQVTLNMYFRNFLNQTDLGSQLVDLSFSGSIFHRSAAHWFDGSPDGQLDTYQPWNYAYWQGCKIPSFAITFQGEYGMGRLRKKFSEFSENVQTRQFRVHGQREEADLILNELTRRLFNRMGNPTQLGTWSPLFINGQPKGMFNLAERLNPQLLSQSHFLPESSHWDIYSIGDPGVQDGTQDFYNALSAYGKANSLAVVSNYLFFLNNFVHIDSFIDYVMIETFVANADWCTNNVHAYRLRDAKSKLTRMRYTVWDVDNSWLDPAGRNWFDPAWRLFSYHWGTADSWKVQFLSGPWTALFASSEFKVRFNDRYYKHFVQGTLRPAAIEELHQPLYAKANALHSVLYGRALSRAKYDQTMAQRPAAYAAFTAAAGLIWPSIVPPTLSQRDTVSSGPVNITMTNTMPGATPYYLVGGDPREIGGAIVGTEYRPGDVVAVTDTTRLCARVSTPTTWSAVDCISILVTESFNLTVTEVMYRHPGGGDLDYIELFNFGDHALYLEDVQINVDGILAYKFPESFSMPNGSYYLISFDPDEFEVHYRSFANGRFIGFGLGRTANISFVHIPTQVTFASFVFSNVAGWPADADGKGKSLVTLTPTPLALLSDPSKWRASSFFGGSPGKEDPPVPPSPTPIPTPLPPVPPPPPRYPSSTPALSPFVDPPPEKFSKTPFVFRPTWWMWLGLGIAFLIIVIVLAYYAYVRWGPKRSKLPVLNSTSNKLDAGDELFDLYNASTDTYY